jgi:putative transposase
VYNRGNNGQVLFFERKNYLFFLKKIKLEVSPFSDVLAYCLMPNHYHLLLSPKTHSEDFTSEQICTKLSRKLGTLQSSYAQAINKEYERTGSLFQ